MFGLHWHSVCAAAFSVGILLGAAPARAADDGANLPPPVADALAKARRDLQGGNLPPPVAEMIVQAREDCPAGFKDEGAVQSVSLTGDGRPSYILDPHRLACAGSPHLFSGDGPSSIELFVTLPSGQVVHTGGVVALAYSVQPSADGGAPILAFETHGVADRAGTISAYRWDGKNFSLLRQQSMAMPPND